jgi:type II secretory pathway pseudopilin PulG
MFDILYPMVSVWARALAATQRRLGVDLGAMTPSARAIRGHLSPAVTSVRRTKGGIEIVQQQSLPGGDTALTASLGAGLLPAISVSRSAARRTQSMNQMKQIVLAMHNYAYTHKTFPPAYTADKDGKPLLSWRVLILPFLGEDPLYKQFHLDEPWDSPHNKKLIARIPTVYKDPSSSVSSQGKANYLTVRGEKTVFPGDRGISFREIRDGSANTIMTVEVPDAKAVIWTRPDDFDYDQTDPKKGLLGMRAGGVIIGLADGSVRFLPSSIRSETLGALFTRDGGESIDWNELEHQSR